MPNRALKSLLKIGVSLKRFPDPLRLKCTSSYGTPSAVSIDFTKQALETDAGKWTATVRLVGIAGVEQLLSGVIILADVTQAAIPFESSLSAEMTGFNTGKKNPLSLSALITVEPEPGPGPDPGPEVEAAFTATINGWKKVDDGEGVAQ